MYNQHYNKNLHVMSTYKVRAGYSSGASMRILSAVLQMVMVLSAYTVLPFGIMKNVLEKVRMITL